MFRSSQANWPAAVAIAFSVLLATTLALAADAPATQPLQIPLPPPIPELPAAAPTAPPQTQPVESGAATSVQPAATLPTTMPATTPATQPASEPSTAPSAGSGHENEVVITADLDRAREQIAPSLGAVSYTLGQSQIQSTPGGENASFQQVLLRAPGVVQDSFGQVHVRGEHANLTYRVNGVLLPESIASGIGGFGQELDTRIVESSTLITGSLPAQFGFHTSGVVDVTTKSGATLSHNELSLYGGSYDTFIPGLLLGGSDGKFDYFVSASYRYTAQGIENPTSSPWPLHDYSNQVRLFTYLNYRIDDTSRVGLMLNTSFATFQIPNVPDAPPAFMLAGHPTANSADTNENQQEQDYYAVVYYQKTIDRLSYQASLFTRYGNIHFTPDPVNDLIFQGVASEITNDYWTNGAQLDASYLLDERNTLRFGLIGSYTSEGLNTNVGVFSVDSTGAQTSDVPFFIASDTGNWGVELGFYAQDEWKITDSLTLNYGARFDIFTSSFDTENQLSPRVNLVWQIDRNTTAHAGYARYFVPPPVQYVWPPQVNSFAGTSNAPENFINDPPKAERSNYYDIGISHNFTPVWQVTVDGFYKYAKPLLDSGQFGSAIIYSSFNYEEGKVYGPEISSTFSQGGLSMFGNFAYVTAEGRNIISNQYLIANDELAFIKNNFIPLDHEGTYTASGGITYAWKDNRAWVDVIYGSGLRSGFANQSKEPQYAPVSVGYEHTFHPHWTGIQAVRLRFDIINIFDEVYQLRNGTGIGVGAPQFGQRRTFLAGLTFDF